MEISNKKIPLDEFLAQRKEVLGMWRTGGDAVDLEEAVVYHKSQPLSKNLSAVMAEARRQGRMAIALRCGKPTVEQQIEDLLYVEKAGADLLPVTLDSYTRNLRFADIDAALGKGQKLNGYPIVNHGVSGGRRIMEAVHSPVTIKHGSIDARLAAEIGFASGMSDINGNVYSWGLTYNKNVSIASIIRVQQYIARLMGYYAEHGVILANEQGGGQGPGCFRVPCISLSNTILGALISAGQGAKCVQSATGQGTNMVQDIASIHVLKKLSREYLDRLGHSDVASYAIYHQWQGAFPEDPDEAMGVICTGAVTAVLGGAEQTVVKSPQEGVGVPTKESNGAGIRAVREVRNIFGGQRMPMSDALLEEMDILEEETRSIIDAVLSLGGGDPALGTLRGIESGVVEVPFTPSIYNYGKAIPVRDAEYAYRFLDCGNLPFSERVKRYNRDRIDARVVKEGGRPAYEMVNDDVFCMMTDRAPRITVSVNQKAAPTVYETPRAKYPDNIVMGVIGSDSHAIGNRLLSYAFTEAGFQVTNLGSFVSQEEFIQAAIETDARVISISSLYGHAAIDCAGLKEKLVEAGLGHVLLYIGGILAVGECDWSEIAARFKALGFDRIAKPTTKPAETIRWLNEDLACFHIGETAQGCPAQETKNSDY